MKKLIAVLTVICFISSSILPAWADEPGTEQSYTTKQSLPELTEAEKEVRMGNLFDLYVTETFVILKDEKIINAVSRILERIVKASESNRTWIKYKVRIINDSLSIASSFPGGYVYISTGLLDLFETDDELAAVLANSIARMSEKYQYDTFMAEWKQRKTALVISRILAVGLFFGGAILGAAAASSSASGAGLGAAQAYQQSIQITSSITGGAVVGVLSAGDAIAKQLPEKKVIFNRMSPYLSIGSTAASSSVYTLFREIYEGYESDKELKAIELAIRYLNKSGYNPKALISVFGKLMSIRNEYLSKGYVSSLLIAQPNLEGRVEHANKVIEKYK